MRLAKMSCAQACPNLIADHSEYIELLKAIEAVPGVKKGILSGSGNTL